MTGFVRLGLVFPPALPPESIRSVAASAEAAGLDDFWVSEDCFKESAVASAVVALAATERVRVGIGLLPVPLRSVAQAAMEFATIDRLFPGRFAGGIGHGVQAWMGQAGVRAEAPLTLLREFATALRRLLDGEEVSVSGRYVVLDEVALAYPPLEPAPLLIGAAGPRSLAAAGELGTGTLLSLGLDVAAVRESTAATLATADPGHEVMASLIVATGPNARARVDSDLGSYGIPGGPDVGAAGDARAIADRMLELAAAGVTGINVQPCADEPNVRAFARFLGSEVRPLLHG
ncbi:LLM class flavin-dependent oxidoreductase [Streptomyces sp. SID13031]|uniref:LLM class flavin-dependent oxidoreductase n=1 Tax=Streptomyces sp. SID13031 TaxID=2706046 RepID=UPI0013C8989B|nr:LLM class flavin-dependent oxidoreductase [Streptomyces sp. SID13031]NEA37533.1 LLM class flavin-dependent oxidoreductase [Streptomyces sp. SID13031]